MNQIIIAGTNSGVGKTTISVGIMKAMMKRGKKVIPFKIGPDYIDTGFHAAATGRASVNVDCWMTGVKNTRFLFDEHRKRGDFSVIEGVMGLYDGLGDEQNTASTAHIAKILSVPVILIIDGSQMAASAGALVLGFREFDKEVNIAGIIVNRVSSDTHYELIKESIRKATDIPCLGYLPPRAEVSLPSRHLGLVPVNETASLNKRIEDIAALIEQYIDLDALEMLSEVTAKKSISNDPRILLKDMAKGFKIGIARDEAFSFYYEDNLELLRYMGAEMISFSPLHDAVLPENLDALYLGGGFPEMFAEKLSANSSFRNSMVTEMKKGIPVYAECGGYMYLTHGIKDTEGNDHEMTGFLEGSSEMTKTLQRFGYAEAITEGGFLFRGHEFHHSQWRGPSAVKHTLSLSKPRELNKNMTWSCGQRKENVHGAYVHLHFYSNLNAVQKICQSILRIKGEKNEKSKI